ncbi:histidine kinase [Leptospira semungkisensis]|uniref:histidine kinase n=1 Tax=Leptospira semungkisensis TaxID=2484985 RepID=A0A4R9G6G6_9LEPT|nr:MASE1 domain-containing protein [Leptospira semungkisensis]TGK07023.1 histidine kinase [Leptospira semungkisensis]
MKTFRGLMLEQSKKISVALAKICLVAIVYFLLGRLGHGLSVFSDYASPIWPASGWSLVTTLLWGRISLPGIFLGSLIYNTHIKSEFLFQPEAWKFISVAAIIAFGSTIQAGVGAYLYRKFIPKLDLTQRTSSVVRFLWIETLVCIIAATIANTCLFLVGVVDIHSILPTWIIWWMGDSLGVFVYFPFFLSWLGPNIARFRAHSWKESLGLVSFLLLLGGGTFYFFKINEIPAYFPLSYLLIVIIALTSLRFGGKESSLVMIVVSILAIIGTIKGNSHYVAPSKEVALLVLQSFLSAVSIASLLVLSVAQERASVEEELVQSHQDLEKLVAERTKELDQSYHFLGTSEAIYKGLFENVPIAIFECDYRAVRERLETLPKLSKREFNRFLKANQQFVNECYDSVRVVDANKESVRLFGAKSKEEVLSLSVELFRNENLTFFRQLLFRLNFGSRILETESVLFTCSGKPFEAAIRWSLAPEFEDTFSSVIITVLEITEKKQAERQLKASLKEKEVMLKEIHHRVKNNLQVISSLFSLQSEYENDPKIHDAFSESQNRIQTMALIHDELYQSNDLGNVEFSGYSKRLAEKIRAAYKIGGEVQLEIYSEIIHLEISLAIPLGLILNELLTNCLKYAFPKDFLPEEGRPIVQVRLRKNGNTISMEVSDNGIGLSSELNQISTPSFGLTLVQVLTKQLKGKLDFSGSKGTGTNFQIRFDLPD